MAIGPDGRGVPDGRPGHARHPAQAAARLARGDHRPDLALSARARWTTSTTYVDCKFGRKPVDVLHPLLEPVLKRDLRRHRLPGTGDADRPDPGRLFSLGEADLLRRAMGKKKKEEMDQQRARFLSGAAERGVAARPGRRASSSWWPSSPATASTSATPRAYALIAYQTAWLKANAPVEFFAASMSLDISNTDKLAVFYQDAKRVRACQIRPPDVNRSGADFEVEDGEVLYALGAIRNVGLAGHGARWSRCARGRAVPRPVRLPRAGRSRARSTSGRWRTWPGPAPSTPPPNRAQIVGGGRDADRLRPERRRRPRLGPGQPVRRRGRGGAAAPAQDGALDAGRSSWTRSWRRSAST